MCMFFFLAGRGVLFEKKKKYHLEVWSTKAHLKQKDEDHGGNDDYDCDDDDDDDYLRNNIRECTKEEPAIMICQLGIDEIVGKQN